MRTVCLVACLVLSVPAASAAESLLVIETGDDRLVIAAGDLADVAAYKTEAGDYGVSAALAPERSAEFADLTEAHIGEEMTLWVCGLPVVVAIIRERIPGGRFTISAENVRAAADLAEKLQSGHCD